MRSESRRLCLAALLVLACSHQEGGAPDLERLRNDPGAVDRARAASSQACKPGPPPPECCSALMEEGDALQARGDQSAAWHAYQRGRSRCPLYAPVRKHIYLMKHPLPAKGGAELDLHVQAAMEPALEDDLRLAYYDLYLDGEPALDRPIHTTVGQHEVAIEVYIEPRTKGEAPARLDEVLLIDVPAPLASEKDPTASISVKVTDRPGATITERVKVDTKASFSSTTRFVAMLTSPRPPAAKPAPTDPDTAKFLPPGIGIKQLLTPREQRVPPELMSRASGTWGLFKICVSKAGAVDGVSIIKSPSRTLDGDFATAIRTWKFQPYLIGGAPVLFCYPMRLEVRRQ